MAAALDDISAMILNKRKPKRDPGLCEASTDLLASGGDEAVSVCIRVRPFNRRELELHESTKKHKDELIRSVVEMPEGVKGALRLKERDEASGDYNEVEQFSFTRTFWSVREDQQPHKYMPITQEDVFDSVGRMVLTNALSGFNVCVFAYGQTGSGKTHTMMGNFTTEGGEFVGDPGLIPRMCRELFDETAKKKRAFEAENPHTTLTFDIKLSALEIYNEDVRDLFWKNSPHPGRTKQTVLNIMMGQKDGAFVQGLTILNPKTWEECIKLIAAGVSERTVAATQMNDESSRSHSVFQILIHETEKLSRPDRDPDEPPIVTTRKSQINLVDLAGSERLKKSGAAGQQQKEAAGINLSLSTLKRIIDALVLNSQNPKKPVPVPYRDSSLTKLLSHSLGGNSKTTMFACVSPHYDNFEETQLTLRYASLTKGIVNKVKANEDSAAKQAAMLKDQVAALQAKLEQGAQAYTEEQLEKLRAEIAAHQAQLAAMSDVQRAKAAEANKLRLIMKKHSDARYTATYYNAFRKALMGRIVAKNQVASAIAERELHSTLRNCADLEENLHRRKKNMESVAAGIDASERSSQMFEKGTEEFKEEIAALTEAIKASNERIEERLVGRFALRWVKNRNERATNKRIDDAIAAVGKQHDTYLASIVREATKQFEALRSTYADKQAAHQRRVDELERQQASLKTKYHNAMALKLSREAQTRQSAEDARRREEEKLAQWVKRYEAMKGDFEEKLEMLRQSKLISDSEFSLKMERLQEESERQREATMADMAARLDSADSEGRRRLEDSVAEMTSQIESLAARAADDNEESLGRLQEQYRADAALLTREINGHKTRLFGLRDETRSNYNAAVQLEATTQRAETAIAECLRKGPTDYVVFLAEVEAFVKRYRETMGPSEFAQFSAVLRLDLSNM